MATAKIDDEVISTDDVSVSPRGRKKVIDESLAERLANLAEGQAIALKGTFGEVPQEKRQAVSATIRKHWDHVRDDKCRIDYSPTGVPQVRAKG